MNEFGTDLLTGAMLNIVQDSALLESIGAQAEVVSDTVTGNAVMCVCVCVCERERNTHGNQWGL